ncbi:hypothetical protein QBC38DRAFT_464135 [Podospora fimiseda]|uniref:Uncharacterized protein n=1 Tax=Podospora fimiseda TaxID=252190 RepID=A0AAN7H265_9PEZI|nr:hypothetical protein QBC38DRAFT_464135 [Podospora fimiseda]
MMPSTQQLLTTILLHFLLIYLPSTNQNSEPASVTVVECCLYEQTSNPHIYTGKLGQDDVAAWLGGTVTPSENGMPLVAGLRVAFGTVARNALYPNETNAIWTDDICRVLGIQENLNDYLRPEGGPGCGRHDLTESESVYAFWRSNDLNTPPMLMKHESVSNITMAYVGLPVGTYPNRSFRLDKIIKTIMSQFARYPHRLLLPLILFEGATSNIVTYQDSCSQQLWRIESATGFAGWGELGAKDIDARLNLTKLIENIGATRHGMASINIALGITQIRVDFLLKDLSLDGGGGGFSSVQSLMGQRLEFLKRRLEHLKFHRALKDRADAQQTVIFNMITQQDSKLNISIASDSKELAAASKRDSSSMKIIAYLTTLFLPATFMSSLFAIPIFNWDAPTLSETRGKHFWIYWAVAIPLTIFVMGTFGVYAWYQGRKNNMRAQKAREIGEEKLKEV